MSNVDLRLTIGSAKQVHDETEPEIQSLYFNLSLSHKKCKCALCSLFIRFEGMRKAWNYKAIPSTTTVYCDKFIMAD